MHSKAKVLSHAAATLGTMDRSYKPSDFVIPRSTSAVLLPSSHQPSFVQSSTRFLRAAYEPTRAWLVTERLDPKDDPKVYNYNVYEVAASSGGTWLSGPRTASSFIPHHLAHPSTWFDSL